MKGSNSRKTDLLDEDQLDQSIDFGQLTDLKGASIVLDLLGNWNNPDHADTAYPDNFSDQSEVIEELQDAESSFGSFNDDATYVPERELVGSLFADSMQNASIYSSPVDRLRLPGLNSVLFGFRLLEELGTGSFAKVFRARQGDLANREVVLKVSAIEGTEPQTLAQLQHTHVVPIYSVHEDPDRGLRAVCMPYFGGTALSKILHEVWRDKPVPEDNGRVVIEALDRIAASRVPSSDETESLDASAKPEPQIQVPEHAARNTIARSTYVQAVAWIIARLAEGLQHSHERNVIHRDIKPSNILLSAEGQPLLLDFNVSQLIDCNPEDVSLGGTIAYMAPEHLRAAIIRDHASMVLVDHQSDIYSLGLVLYEMLAGNSPFEKGTNATLSPDFLNTMLIERQRTIPSLREQTKLDIPWSLESILRKSTAPDPVDRYATAEQFADDLNCFLNDLPLKFAPELSRIEQVQKWIRRHPRLKATALVSLAALALIIPGGIALRMTRHDLAASINAVKTAEAYNEADQFEKDAVRALSMTNLFTEHEATQRAGIEACRQTLNRFGVLKHADWQVKAPWTYLSFDRRIKLSESVRELLLVLAGAEVRNATDLNEAALQALNLLKIAERLRSLPPSRALLIDRERYLLIARQDAQAADARRQADRTAADSAYDKYMLATAFMRDETPQGLKQAIHLLSQSIEETPTHFWSHFERALCAQQLGDYVLATADFGTCIGLSPKSSWSHFNLGYLLEKQGRRPEALHSYTQAIECDQDFLSAYVNRAMLRIELGHFQLALEDIDKAEKLGRDDVVLDAGRAMAYEGLGKHADADREFAAAMKRVEQIPGSPIDRISWTYAMAVSQRAPQIANQVFNDILKIRPEHPQAHYGQGMLLMQADQLESAIRSFDNAIKADAGFIAPVRYRAICLARLGRIADASADAEYCISREPTNPETFYTSTCVLALAARQTNSSELAEEALRTLKLAIVHTDPQEVSALLERAANDEDLSRLRSDKEFQRITGTEVKKPDSKPAKET